MERLTLLDEEYPFTGFTHTRKIARAILLFPEGIAIHTLHRDDKFGNQTYLETPGGGVDEGESFEEAVIRECLEETGYQVEVIDPILEVEDAYNAFLLEPSDEHARMFLTAVDAFYRNRAKGGLAADSLAKSFTFIHASSSGVTISHIDEPYYAQRFIGVRRILPDFPPEERTHRARFSLKELIGDRTGAARDSALNAVQERALVLFPDGSWAFTGEDGQYVAPPGDKDFILNADGTWRFDEASSAEFYTVRAGDTFAKIAKKYGISVESLLEMNGLTRRSVLRLGDRLRVQ